MIDFVTVATVDFVLVLTLKDGSVLKMLKIYSVVMKRLESGLRNVYPLSCDCH